MVTLLRYDAAPRTILAASTGGHLEQLIRLRKRLRPEPSSVVWVTPDEPQSRSLLAGQPVYHLKYVPPRRADLVLANSPATHQLLREGRYDRVVSTGAAMALSVLAMARARGIPCHWIESSARAAGPSLTGRIVSGIPGMHLYTQYPSWADGRWAYRGSVLDAYRAVNRLPPLDGLARRVVVTFGTQKGYSFRRGLEALLKVLPSVLAPDAQVLWQTGVTDLSGLSIEAKSIVPAAQIREAIADADLVIAHAGVGSALTALDQGRVPVLLPRLRKHAEMVDDHQLMIAAELESRGLAISRAPEDLTPDDLRAAMRTGVTAAEELPPFELME
jgi:UDP-N-acetylglucosamine--N-acetylmuramyl-(pentapeptide) pyrophosphoryl-undecaprenol N-acetylglucosamine transferase